MQSTSAIIINWNTREHLLRCVESLLSEGLDQPSILAIDQGSSDGSLDALGAKFPHVRAISIQENIGYAHAVNCSAAKTNASFLLVANADILVGKGTVRLMTEVMQRDKEIGMLGCTVLDSRGNTATRFSRTSVTRGILLELVPTGFRGLWRDAEQLGSRDTQPFPVTYVEGAFFMVRSEAFYAVGGMDEGFTFFYEDADLPMRMIKSGFQVLHVPAASVTHHGGASFSQVPERHASEFHRNMIRLYSRHSMRRAVWLKRAMSAVASMKVLTLGLLSFAGEDVQRRIRRNRTILRSLNDIPKAVNSEQPLVSVIVPTYNRRDLVRALADNLRHQTYSNFETIVVDQSNAEGQPPDISGVRWLSVKRANRSLAKNVGLREAKGDILLFCDDDIVPETTMIETHVKAHSNSSIGGVSCRVTEEGLTPLTTNNICRVTWYGRMIDRFQSNTECFVETLVGGNMSVKREVLTEAGYFDSIFAGTSIFEEQDLSERIRNLGFKILFTNRSSVHHQPQRDGNVGLRSADPFNYYHDFHHNEIVFFLKNRNHLLLPFVIPFCFLRTVKQSLRYRLSFRQGMHIFAGVLAGIRAYYRSMK